MGFRHLEMPACCERSRTATAIIASSVLCAWCFLPLICSAQAPWSHTIEHLVFMGTTTCTESFDTVCNSFGSTGSITGSYSVDITANTIVGPWSFSTPFGKISSQDAGAQATLYVNAGSNIQPYFEVSTSTVLEFVKFNFPIADVQETGAIENAPGSNACINIPGGELGQPACDPNDVLAGSNALSWSATINPSPGAPYGTIDGLPESMNATFAPVDAHGAPYSLNSVASDLGFSALNYQQQVTGLFAPSGVYPCAPSSLPPGNIYSDGSLQAPPSFFDPPDGGYDGGAYGLCGSDDPFPFYWTADDLANGLTLSTIAEDCGLTSNPTLGVPIETSYVLRFQDCPTAGVVGFTTSLVGGAPCPAGATNCERGFLVTPLFTWKWFSTFDGIAGGTYHQTKSPLPPDPGSGTGGVMLTSINGVSLPPIGTPTMTVTPSEQSITTIQVLSVAIAVGGGSGNPTPTGSVTLSSRSYSSAATALSSGSATISVPAGSLAVGTDTLTAIYTGDGSYNTHAGFTSVNVTTPAPASFAVTGTGVNVAPGATSANTSTITVTPAGGFTGSVTLTAAVTSSPAGAQFPPTLSFGSTSPVSITSMTPGTATLTITTTAAARSSLAHPGHSDIPWYAKGGAALACMLMLGIPARRRNWPSVVGALALLAALTAGVVSCGGGNGGGGGGGGIAGTTAGSYTITVTATSGAITETGTVALTVQ